MITVIFMLLATIFACLWIRSAFNHSDTRTILSLQLQDERALRIGEQKRHGTAIHGLTNRLRIAEASADVMAMHTAVLCDELKTKTVF